jgi:hypothetical protein
VKATTARRKTDRAVTVGEAAKKDSQPQPIATKQDFDDAIVSEIIEAKNQTLDWWNGLKIGTQHELYAQQLAKPPRKSVVNFAQPAKR